MSERRNTIPKNTFGRRGWLQKQEINTNNSFFLLLSKKIKKIEPALITLPAYSLSYKLTLRANSSKWGS